MKAHDLFQAGRLDEAIESLGFDLRNDPGDARRRTFLFELLCFAGAWDRAQKQLDVLSGGGQSAAMGALLYQSALHAERIRQEMFQEGNLPSGNIPAREVGGNLNGAPFRTIADADSRIGPRLEIFAAGQYVWLPLEHVASVQTEAPKRLRDLLWLPALVRTGPSFRGAELGEVLLPVMTPGASAHPDPLVRLGRVTDWTAVADGSETPVGQKMLQVDDEIVSLLEVREISIATVPVGTS